MSGWSDGVAVREPSVSPKAGEKPWRVHVNDMPISQFEHWTSSFAHKPQQSILKGSGTASVKKAFGMSGFNFPINTIHPNAALMIKLIFKLKGLELLGRP